MVLRRVVQTVGVFKVSRGHFKLFCPLVHPGDKGFFGSRNVFRKRYGSVVGGGDHHAFDHILHRHLLALFQVDLRAAHRAGVCAGSNRVGELDLSTVKRFHDKKQRHDLGDRCRRKRLVLIFGVKHLAGGRLHQNRRFTVQLQFRRAVAPLRSGIRHNDRRLEQKPDGKQKRKDTSAPSSPFSAGSVIFPFHLISPFRKTNLQNNICPGAISHDQNGWTGKTFL